MTSSRDEVHVNVEMMMSTSFRCRAGMRLGVVTHEMQFARDVGDNLVFMDEGRIVEQGRPAAVLSSPSEERTRRFLRRTLLLDHALEGMSVKGMSVKEGGAE